MFDLSYTLPTGGVDRHVKGNCEGIYFETPAVFAEDGQVDELATKVHVEERVLHMIVHARRRAQLKDTDAALRGLHDIVYVNNQVVREDHTLAYDEARPIVDQLKEAFPTGYDFESRISNVVGSYDGYREPYENPSISFYEFTTPSDELLAKYNVDKGMYNYILDWYGLKFDLVSKSVILKVVCDRMDLPTPPYPRNCYLFYATTHHEDGTMDRNVDAYVWTTWHFMKAYCDEHSLPYPVEDETIAEKIVQWGVVYDMDTLELKVVKGYYEYGEIAAS